MVKENAVAGEKTITLPVIHRHPKGIDFSRSVGTPGIEGSFFILRWWRIAKHLATGRLVKFCLYPAPP